MTLFLAFALAGPFGPDAEDVVPHAPEAATSCDDTYPFALDPMPREPDLFRLFAPDRAYGTPAMVDTLVGAFARVAAAHPDADPVFVGDISRERGGDLPPHRSHNDGRSADIGLFVNDGEQPERGFTTSVGQPLDVARTWTLIDALLDTGEIEHILLDQRHVKQLVDYAVARARNAGSRDRGAQPGRQQSCCRCRSSRRASGHD